MDLIKGVDMRPQLFLTAQYEKQLCVAYTHKEIRKYQFVFYHIGVFTLRLFLKSGHKLW